MYKPLLFLFFLALLTTACTPAETAVPPTIVPTAPTIIIPTPPATEPACTGLGIEPTPGPEVPSLFAPISADDHIRGSEDAVLTLIVYDDFQCVECNYLPLSQELFEKHPGDVRIVYRYYPYTTLFDKAELVARAAEATSYQDKFWEMHDLLFEDQADWVNLSVDDFEGWVTAKAQELGLDKAQFTADLNSMETIEKVQKAAEEGARVGIPKLPFLLLNGQIYNGPVDYEAFSQTISLLKLGKRQFSQCPPMTIDMHKQYFATLETEKGDIVLQLYADKAPWTVNSFIFLARHGWFDDITFHRVLPGFVAQTGDPSGTGQGNPGYIFQNEIAPTLKFAQAGLVAMANSGPDSNGSQFFITYGPAPHLDGNYTIFGKVLSGMDVVEQLTPRDPQPGSRLPPGDKLISVTIEEK